ncbi:MAG: EamA family transporter [Tetrasphaera sp.]|nr:EamA family transporter [Tetrasphaera sp.]
MLAGIVSVQFGGALAATLIPHIGAAGSVTMRLLFASVILCAVVRPRLRGYSAAAWRTVILFGLALGLMNFAFYGSLAHLPIGVAVTIEFIGPLLLSAVLSRRLSDYVAVAGAAVGVVLISEALHVPLDQLSWAGILLALTAGACWAAYIILSGRTGAAFPKLDGLAIAMLIATCFVAPFGLATVGDWSAPLLAKGLGIAVLSSLLPYSLELIALRRMSAAVFGILLSLEPACAALAGLLVLGQRLHVWQLLGMALVVGASILIMGGGGTEKDPAEAAAT